jgi:hypothetical protein
MNMSPPKMFCFLSVATCKCYVTLYRYKRQTVQLQPRMTVGPRIRTQRASHHPEVCVTEQITHSLQRKKWKKFGTHPEEPRPLHVPIRCRFRTSKEKLKLYLAGYRITHCASFTEKFNVNPPNLTPGRISRSIQVMKQCKQSAANFQQRSLLKRF